MERAPSQIASHITEAEEAILYELLAHPFTNQAERRSLQDALTNLRAIRDNLDSRGNPQIMNAIAHRSTRRNRVRHC